MVPLMSRFIVIVLMMSVLTYACLGESELSQLEYCLDHPAVVNGMQESLGLLGDRDVWLEERGVDVLSDAPLSEQDLVVLAGLDALVNHPDPVTAEADRVAIRVNWLTNTSDGMTSCQAAYDAR